MRSVQFSLVGARDGCPPGCCRATNVQEPCAGARVVASHGWEAIRVHHHAARANRTPQTRKDMSQT